MQVDLIDQVNQVDLIDGQTWTYHDGPIHEVSIYGEDSASILDQVDTLWTDTAEWDGEESYVSVGVRESDLAEVVSYLEASGFVVRAKRLTEASQSGDSCSEYAYFPIGGGGGWMVRSS